MSIPISIVAGKAFVFDIEHVKTLREQYNILGVLTGTLPVAPQQLLFLSVPLLLLAGEVIMLVCVLRVAFLVDEKAATLAAYLMYTDSDREDFLAKRWQRFEKEIEGKKQEIWRIRAKKVKGALAMPPKKEIKSLDLNMVYHTIPTTNSEYPNMRWVVDNIQQQEWFQRQILTQYLAQAGSSLVLMVRGARFMRFLRDSDKTSGFYVSPGLKFGLPLIVYPGDPLRYHSQLIVSFYGYHEGIKLLDVVAGGRLAIGVKKLWTISATEGEKETIHKVEKEELSQEVKTGRVVNFSIEWAGFG